MKKFVCKVCGYIYEGDAAPAECPVCHAKSNMFEEVKGDLTLAAEHEYGIYAKTVKNNPDIPEADKQYIFDQLKANFNGECSEVGMYLCMARIAPPRGLSGDRPVLGKGRLRRGRTRRQIRRNARRGSRTQHEGHHEGQPQVAC